MNKRYASLIALLFALTSFLSAQNNMGTPYSMYGIGLFPDNNGPYSGLAGVSAAMRDNTIVNYLNPASYTALDSMRFYFQTGITGEAVRISNYQYHSVYTVAQNASVNMAVRVFKNLFTSFGFNKLTDIGYDITYFYPIVGSKYDEGYYSQLIEGDGGINEFYLGLGYRIGPVSIGVNGELLFGHIEKRNTLTVYSSDLTLDEDAYSLRTRNRTRLLDYIFTFGVQVPFRLSQRSKLTLGATYTPAKDLRAEEIYLAYAILGSSYSITLDSLVENKGGKTAYGINLPAKATAGFCYEYNDRLTVAGDYAYQQMSKYYEFSSSFDFRDYHRGSIGLGYQPNSTGRHWLARNIYQIGHYYTRSHINPRNKLVDIHGITFGVQMPIKTYYQEMMLGVAFDLGTRGTETDRLLRENYAKIRLNISFKESWFMKQTYD